MFKYFAPFYDQFMKTFSGEMTEKTFNKLQVNKGEKILDVGGGTGRLAKMIKEKNRKTEIYTFDQSLPMLNHAKDKELENIIKGNSATLPFKNNTFNKIVCSDALHHFKKKRKSLEEMIRVLKPEGKLIILEFTPKSPITKIIYLGERLLGEPTKFYKPEKLAKFFRKKHTTTKIEKINTYQYFLTVKKKK